MAQERFELRDIDVEFDFEEEIPLSERTTLIPPRPVFEEEPPTMDIPTKMLTALRMNTSVYSPLR